MTSNKDNENDRKQIFCDTKLNDAVGSGASVLVERIDLYSNLLVLVLSTDTNKLVGC